MKNHYAQYSRVLGFARKMRLNPTKAEAEFWKYARKRNLFGLKFNRQFILRYRKDQEKMAYYIADFYNHKFKLVIEIDGEIHDTQIQQDLMRTEMITSLGYKVLRFTNFQVLNDMDAVIDAIEKFLNMAQAKP